MFLIFDPTLYSSFSAFDVQSTTWWASGSRPEIVIEPVAVMPSVGYKPKGYQVGAYQPVGFLAPVRKPVTIKG